VVVIRLAVFENTLNRTYLVLRKGYNATNESVAACVWFRLLGNLLAPSSGNELKGLGALISFYYIPRLIASMIQKTTV
jgi:CobQ-like glutamine amidotransferase family enzyme